MKKYIVFLSFIATLLTLQSCDERITPNAESNLPPPATNNQGALTAHAWQFSEVSVRIGSDSKVLYTRSTNTPANSDFKNRVFNFKADGTLEQTNGTNVEKAKWKFASDETQFILTDSDNKNETYDIIELNDSQFNYRLSFKKSQIDADSWAFFLSIYGGAQTATEIILTFRMIPK